MIANEPSSASSIRAPTTLPDRRDPAARTSPRDAVSTIAIPHPPVPGRSGRRPDAVAPHFREPPSMTQHFRLETIDGVTVATWTDPKVVPEAKDLLYDLAGDERLLLDLGSVRFLSSNALAILVNFQKKVTAAGGRL